MDIKLMTMTFSLMTCRPPASEFLTHRVIS